MTEPEQVLLRIMLPIPISVLGKIGKAMSEEYGDGIYMRQVGPVLELFKPATEQPPAASEPPAAAATDAEP